jgi:hypothetical protein
MRGVPMGVIAEQHGHADTPMTEKHYAHLASTYIANTIRAHSRRSVSRVTPQSQKLTIRRRADASGQGATGFCHRSQNLIRNQKS